MSHRRALAAVLLTAVASSPLPAQAPVDSRYLKIHDVGTVQRAVPVSSFSIFSYKGLICEYPRGSGIDHIYSTSGKFEIGTLAPPGDTLQYRYCQGNQEYGFTANYSSPSDTLWAVTDNTTRDLPFWPAYQGISDQDFVCRYSTSRYGWGAYCDTTIPFPYQPVPLEVIEQSFAWINPPMSDVIVYAFHIRPTEFDLEGGYLVLHFFGGIGKADPGLVWESLRSRYLDDQSTYFPDEHLGIVADGPFGFEGQAKSCIGYKLFPPANAPSGALKWSFSDDGGQHDPASGNFEDAPRESAPCIRSERDRTTYMYNLVTSGINPVTTGDRGSGYISCGPIELKLGDTATFWTAEILGNGSDDILRKAAILDSLYSRGFHTPIPPPPPHARTERGDKRITIRWDPLPGEVNPETYADPWRGDNIGVPFEGYRVYKSINSIDGPWVALAEYDVAGDGFGRELGLQHSYTDVGLLNNCDYYYSVTAFSKEDTVYGFRSRESRIALSAVKASPGIPPARGVGEVAAVPNPYRGDIAYSQYTPAWEKPSAGRSYWAEQDRRIQFINLPVHCVIKIYTLAGDVVETLYHDDPVNSYHDWNLTSHVGQATASGIYLFTVEDLAGGGIQVGKFVIIK